MLTVVHTTGGMEVDKSCNNASANDSTEHKEDDKTEENNVTDPFQYLDRGEFTSERYKIEISNLPKQCRKHCYAELKKRLTKTLHLNPHKIKPMERMPFAFVTFRCEEDREDALKKINGHKWKESVLEAKKAQPLADPLLKKRKQKEEGSEQSNKKKKLEEIEDNTPPDIRLKNSVTPLWNVPYEEQLKKKTEEAIRLLKFLVHKQETKEFFIDQRKQFNGMCCELLPVVPSPILKGYRNKSEFSIGMGLDGKDPIVGFRFGAYRDGNKCVGKPDVIEIIPDKMNKVVECFQDFLKHSEITVFDPESHQGHWHQLTVRTTQGTGIMAVVEFHPQNLTKVELDRVKASLAEYFSEGEGKAACVTSLYFHQSRARSIKENENVLCEHIYGERHICEDLLGMKFRISPDSFFQVNTLAAKCLYNQIIDWCNIKEDTVVLDICCGTGTIGLSVAKRAAKVIGIEMCKQAIEDANANAELNGITNVEYHCGRAEDVITDIMKKVHTSHVVAIVDPPRAGLHKTVIKALRSCSKLQRLVYASCSPKSVKPNFIDLIRRKSKKHLGESFIPIKAVPIDLFPQTSHCELVVLFQRLTNESNSAGVKEIRDVENTDVKMSTEDESRKAAQESNQSPEQSPPLNESTDKQSDQSLPLIQDTPKLADQSQTLTEGINNAPK